MTGTFLRFPNSRFLASGINDGDPPLFGNLFAILSRRFRPVVDFQLVRMKSVSLNQYDFSIEGFCINTIDLRHWLILSNRFI